MPEDPKGVFETGQDIAGGVADGLLGIFQEATGGSPPSDDSDDDDD